MNNNNIFDDVCNKYKLNENQRNIFKWLKEEGLNTDDNTLAYWSWKYSEKRLRDVVQFAKSRQSSGQNIRNMGGWIQKMLKSEMQVVNDECQSNRDLAAKYANTNGWTDLSIFEKYVKDNVTKDDLPLTLPKDDFMRMLEALHNKSRLYKGL
jgi:hypothetical protein